MNRFHVLAAASVGAWLLAEILAWGAGSRILLAAAVAPLVVLPIALARARGRSFDPVDPVWLVMIVLLFAYGLVPALELFDPEPFESVQGHLRLSPPHIYAASWIGGLGLVSFSVAYFSGVADGPARRAADLLPRVGPRRVALTGAVLSVLGLLAIETVLVLADAPKLALGEIFRGGLREATLTVTDGRGYLAIGYLALSVGLLCLVAAIAMAGTPGSRWSRWVIPAALAAMLVSLLVFGLVLGSRQNAVVTAVGSLVIVHLLWRRIPTAVWGAGLGVATAFGVVALASRNADGLRLDPVEWAGTAAKTFDGFNFTVTGLARAERPLYGQTMVEDLGLTYVPRVLVPDKPTEFGIVRAEEIVIGDVPSGTFPPGLLMEGYLNLGVIGVVLVAAAAALLLRGSYEAAIRSGAAFATVVLAYLLSNVSAIARGLGPVLPTLVVVSVMLAPLLIPSRLVGRVSGAVGTRALAVGAAAVVLLLALAIPVVVNPITAPDEEDPPRLAVGSPAPPIPGLPAPSGETPTLRVFWSSWCEGCAEQLAELDAVASEAAVQIVAFQDTEGASADALAGRPWPSVVDDGTATIAAYGVPQLPSTAVLNAEGRLACTIVGPATAAQIRAALDLTVATGRCS